MFRPQTSPLSCCTGGNTTTCFVAALPRSSYFLTTSITSETVSTRRVVCEQGFGDELLSVCLEKVTKLLSDDMYFARRHGACLATVLYRKWTRPQVKQPSPHQVYVTSCKLGKMALLVLPVLLLLLLLLLSSPLLLLFSIMAASQLSLEAVFDSDWVVPCRVSLTI